MFGLFWFWTYKTNLTHQKLEQEKDEKYKAELLIAAKKAEAANEAKTEFLQRMSMISGLRLMEFAACSMWQIIMQTI